MTYLWRDVMVGRRTVATAELLVLSDIAVNVKIVLNFISWILWQFCFEDLHTVMLYNNFMSLFILNSTFTVFYR